MAVNRRQNWLGQQRVDITHLRAADAATAYDLDAVAGMLVGGGAALVVRGFAVLDPATAVGQPAARLRVATAGGLVCHPKASEPGSLLRVPDDRLPESLSSQNPRVAGSFSASATNYVGVDFRRHPDPSTEDRVAFWDPSTEQEQVDTVPLARTLDYVLVVGTTPFESLDAVAPVAVVVTDAANNVASLADARDRLFRLGSGGSAPDPDASYPWPQGRTEPLGADPFAGGDRGINSLREWMAAVMTRVWELGGGPRWYSPTADRNVKLGRLGSPFSNGEYFSWDGTDLLWKGVRFVFSNCPGTFNDVADQTVPAAGLTDLADGECLYCDLDFAADRTGGASLLAAKAPWGQLGAPVLPGGRFVVAWRSGTEILVRDQPWPVNTAFRVASTSALGVAKLSKVAADPAAPVVLTSTERDSFNGVAGLDSVGVVLGAGLQRQLYQGPGNLVIGDDTNTHQIRVSGIASDGSPGVWVQDLSRRGDNGVALEVDQHGQLLSLTTDGNAAVGGIWRGPGWGAAEALPGSPSGNYGGAYQSGGGGGTVTPAAAGSAGSVSGEQWFFRVWITKSGGVGVGEFRWSRDGVTFTSAAAIPSSYTDSTARITVAFSGTFVAGDRYSWRPRFSPLWVGRDSAGHVRSVTDHNGLRTDFGVSELNEEWTDYTWSGTTSTTGRWTLSGTNNITVSVNGADTYFYSSYMSLDKLSATSGDLAALQTSRTLVCVGPPSLIVAAWEMLVTTTNTTFQVGFRDGTSANALGVYFEKTAAASGWRCVAAGAGGVTTVSTNYVTVGETFGTVGRFRISVEGESVRGTRTARFWINEDLVAEISINVDSLPLAFMYTASATATGSPVLGRFSPLRCRWTRMLSCPAL